MIKAKDIKPIPNYIIKKIKQLDEKERFYTDTSTRYYSYLTKINKDFTGDTYLPIDYSHFEEIYSSEIKVDEKSNTSFQFINYKAK